MMSDSSRVTARLDPQHEKNLVLTNCLIPQKSPEFVSTWRSSHVTRWRSFKLFASVHNKQRFPPVKETETWVKSKQNIWSLSLLNHSRPQISPSAPKILCLQRKKKLRLCYQRTQNTFISAMNGEKKKRPKHEFSRVVSPQRPTTDRNFELFWWLVGEKCYLVIRGRRTCHRKGYTALTFAVQRGSQRAIVWRPADFAYKQALAENFITDELMTATKKLPIKCLRTAVFRDNELLSLLELKLSFEVILLYFDTWGGFCVCGMIIFSSGWLEKIWNE